MTFCSHTTELVVDTCLSFGEWSRPNGNHSEFWANTSFSGPLAYCNHGLYLVA